jgi:hypothetical protein
MSRSLTRQARITAYRINEYLVKIRHFPYTQRRVSHTPYPPTLGPSERLTFISHCTTLPLMFTSLHTPFLFCSILNFAVTIIFLANADSLLLFFYCSSVSWFRPTIVLIFIFTPFSLLSLCINTLLTLNTTQLLTAHCALPKFTSHLRSRSRSRTRLALIVSQPSSPSPSSSLPRPRLRHRISRPLGLVSRHLTNFEALAYYCFYCPN